MTDVTVNNVDDVSLSISILIQNDADFRVCATEHILVTCHLVAFLSILVAPCRPPHLAWTIPSYVYQSFAPLLVVCVRSSFIIIVIMLATTTATTSLRRLAAADLMRRTTFRAFAAASGSHKVVTLEELDDVTKFRQDNPKSVLYFTGKCQRGDFDFDLCLY